MIRDLIVSWYGEQTYLALAYLYRFYPIWLPILTGLIFWEIWVRYVRSYFFFNTKTTLLEITLPQELTKSPLAMELVFTGLYQTGGESTFIDRYWKGQTRAWYSFEIVSHGGDVRFYIWTRENMRNLVESLLYSQYPNIEVRVVDDYAKDFDYDPTNNNMWAINYELEAADPYPIKTYIDYGLDKDPDEEYKNDPLTTIIEYLGTLRPGEQAWVQFIIRAHREEKRGFFTKRSDWKSEALSLRDTILKEIFESKKEFGGAGRRPTKGEEEIIHAIERSVRKWPFDFASRAIYIVHNRDLYNRTTVTALRTLMRPFSSAGGVKKNVRFNGFKGTNSTDWDYPWEDFMDLRVDRRKRKMLDGFKRRSAFFPPHPLKIGVLNTEELATIYHLPGAVAATPGLKRIPSKRAQPPTNLPV